MYVREIDGQELDLTVSGMLWDYSLIMRDEQTESLWSHILGECVQGKYQGRKLEMLPSVLTDFATWRRMHPDSSMLNWPNPRDATWKNDVYEVLSHEKFVIGVIRGEDKRHFSLQDLLQHPIINETIGDTPIVLYFDSTTGAAWCFERSIEGQVVEFKEVDEKIVDSEFSLEWDLGTGRSTDGKQLKAVVNIPSTRAAWINFHPDSARWSAD